MSEHFLVCWATSQRHDLSPRCHRYGGWWEPSGGRGFSPDHCTAGEQACGPKYQGGRAGPSGSPVPRPTRLTPVGSGQPIGGSRQSHSPFPSSPQHGASPGIASLHLLLSTRPGLHRASPTQGHDLISLAGHLAHPRPVQATRCHQHLASNSSHFKSILSRHT